MKRDRRLNDKSVIEAYMRRAYYIRAAMRYVLCALHFQRIKCFKENKHKSLENYEQHPVKNAHAKPYPLHYGGRRGVPDKFIEHGRVDELQKMCGIDTGSIYNKIKGSVASGKKSVSEIKTEKTVEPSPEVKQEPKPKKKKAEDPAGPTLF